MAKKTKGKQKTDEISAGKNVGSNTAPAPEPTAMSAAVTGAFPSYSVAISYLISMILI
jgi:hypothetical protein